MSSLMGSLGSTACILVERWAGRGSRFQVFGKIAERVLFLADCEVNHHLLGEEVGGLSTIDLAWRDHFDRAGSHPPSRPGGV